MTQLSSQKQVKWGRVFPEKQLSSEEKARRKVEDKIFYKVCRQVFDRVQPELIKDHYDWFIIIEPDSGDYFIDPDKDIAQTKSEAKHSDKKCLIMRINETGACGRI
jgi:hypothetical protein